MSIRDWLKEAFKPMPMDGRGMCMTWGHRFQLVRLNEQRAVYFCPICGDQREVT